MTHSETLISHHKVGFVNNKIENNFIDLIVESTKGEHEYVEFDVQMTFDKKFIIYHDNNVMIDGINKPIRHLTLFTIQKNYPNIIELRKLIQLISGKKKAHVDLKFKSDSFTHQKFIYEIKAIQEILQYMKPEDIIITTLEDDSVKAIREWSMYEYPELLVGLSLGRHISEGRSIAKNLVYLSEYYAGVRLHNCRANLIVARKDLARKRLLKLGIKLDLPVLVWTVDSSKDLNNFIRDERVWMITTNDPERALKIRHKLVD